jgi:hypothetical protein
MMSGAYPQQGLGGATPTGEALQKVIDGLPEFRCARFERASAHHHLGERRRAKRL